MTLKEYIYETSLAIYKARKFLKYYKNETDLEVREIYDYIRKIGRLQIFNYPWTKNYDEPFAKDAIEYDKENKMFYAIHSGRKMYFSKNKRNLRQCAEYYRLLLMEQDLKSPHRYLLDDFCLSEDDVVLDSGVAEGNFSVENISKVKKIILIEYDQMWIDALKLTFAEELNSGKIILIEKKLSQEDSEDSITIDSIFKKFPDISFVKMDIEGFEIPALNGARYFLENCKKGTKLAVCTYHNAEDYDKISNLLKKNFSIEHSYGFMAVGSIFGEPHGYFKPPYLRRGVIRATKN